MNGKHARLFRRFFAWAGITAPGERRARMAVFERMSAHNKHITVERMEAAMAKDTAKLPPRRPYA